MLMTLPFVLGWLLLLLPVPLGLGEDSATIMLISGRYLTGGLYYRDKDAQSVETQGFGKGCGNSIVCWADTTAIQLPKRKKFGN